MCNAIFSIVSWDNSVTYFKSASTLNVFDPAEIMDIDMDTPPITYKSENDYDRNISFNTYSEKDWKYLTENNDRSRGSCKSTQRYAY